MELGIVKVIIVTYNGDQFIVNCLSSLMTVFSSNQILIIDNHSEDETISILAHNYPEVNVIHLVKNFGFAYANNVGMKICIRDERIQYFLLVNQDTVSNLTAINELVDYAMRFRDFVILSPIHLNVDKNIDLLFEKFLNEDKYDYKSIAGKKAEAPYPVSFINAAYWLVSKQFIVACGGFDHLLFPHYGEDNNMCQRVKYYGFKTGVLSHVSIVHNRSQNKASRDYQTVVRRHFIHLNTHLADINIRFLEFVLLYFKNLLKEIISLISNLLSFKFKIIYIKISLMIEGRALNFFKIMKSRKISRKNPKYWLNSSE